MLRLISTFSKAIRLIKHEGPVPHRETPPDLAKLDSEPDSFFKHKDHSLESYHLLLRLHAQRKQFDKALTVYKKMPSVGLVPDEKAKHLLIKASCSAGIVEQSQKLFAECLVQYGPSKYPYTSMIKMYGLRKDGAMVLKLIQEMRERGIKPDVPAYTAAIRGLLRAHRIQDCWAVYDSAKKQPDLPLDTQFYQTVILVCAATHDSQRAVFFWNELNQQQVPLSTHLKNAYILALGKRADYCQKAIDMFYSVVERGEENEVTFTAGLTACAVVGAVNQAFQILNLQRRKGLPTTDHTLNSILRVYSGAVKSPELRKELRQQYIKDSWNILKKIEQMGKVNTHHLNHMLDLYCGCRQLNQVEGKVLPLFQRFGLALTDTSYDLLMTAYKVDGNLAVVMRLWEQARQDNLPITFRQADVFLETSVKLADIKQTVNALRLFREMKRKPRTQQLASIGRIQNLPVEVYAELMEFKEQFGVLRQKQNIDVLENKELRVIQRGNHRKRFGF